MYHSPVPAVLNHSLPPPTICAELVLWTDRVLPGHGTGQSSREAIYRAHWERDGGGDDRRYGQYEIVPSVSCPNAVRMPVVCLLEDVRQGSTAASSMMVCAATALQ